VFTATNDLVESAAVLVLEQAIARDPDFRAARCRDGNGTLTHLFFSDEAIDTARAKAICGKCPLSVACLEGALERAEPWGVWGGEIFERGAVVPRKRPRGRPSKADLARDRAYAEALSA
jgi:WhiB family transcriptional regulator, redox-sensing transcriptional regulator